MDDGLVTVSTYLPLYPQLTVLNTLLSSLRLDRAETGDVGTNQSLSVSGNKT